MRKHQTQHMSVNLDDSSTRYNVNTALGLASRAGQLAIEPAARPVAGLVISSTHRLNREPTRVDYLTSWITLAELSGYLAWWRGALDPQRREQHDMIAADVERIVRKDMATAAVEHAFLDSFLRRGRVS